MGLPYVDHIADIFQDALLQAIQDTIFRYCKKNRIQYHITASKIKYTENSVLVLQVLKKHFCSILECLQNGGQ